MKKLRPFLFIIVVLVIVIALFAAAIVMPKPLAQAKSNTMDEIAELITVGDYSKAIEKLDKYEGKYGADDKSNYNRALSLSNLGKNDEARRYLYSCSSFFGEHNAEYRYLLGELDRKAGNLIGASYDYLDALKINPDHYESLFRLGQYYYENSSDCYDAIHYLRAAVVVYDQDPASLFLLGKAYLNIADYEDAKYFIDRACEFSYAGVIKAEAEECYKIIAEHEEKGGLR